MFEIPCKLGHGQVLQVFHDVPTTGLMCTFSSVDIATGSPPVFRSDPIIDHPRSSKGSVKTCFDMSRYGENMEKMFKTFSVLRTD